MTRKIYRPRKVTAPVSAPVGLEVSRVMPSKSDLLQSIELVKSASMDSSGTSETSADDSGHSLDNFASMGDASIRRNSSSSSGRRRKSIIKPVHSMEDLAIKDKPRSWKALPKPDMGLIRRRSLESSDFDGNEAPIPLRRSGSVGFGDIKIREYSQTIGDNPSVSYGPPIALDWEYEEKENIKIDDYEQERAPRRSLRDMCMNYYQRKNRLMALYGHSEEELKKAKRDVQKMQRERALTKAFLPMSKLEDAIQSAARKTKRLTGKNVRDASV